MKKRLKIREGLRIRGHVTIVHRTKTGVYVDFDAYDDNSKAEHWIGDRQFLNWQQLYEVTGCRSGLADEFQLDGGGFIAHWHNERGVWHIVIAIDNSDQGAFFMLTRKQALELRDWLTREVGAEV